MEAIEGGTSAEPVEPVKASSIPHAAFCTSILRMCELLNECEHWSFRALDSFRRWLENFEPEDRWLAAILLDKLTAISSRHESQCLHQGLQEWLLHASTENGPYASAKEKRDALKAILRESAITPVCGESPDPSDSGNSICRAARYALGNRVETLDTEGAVKHVASGKRLILVDDCVGSGSQVEETLKFGFGGDSLLSLVQAGAGARVSLVGTIGEKETLERLEALGMHCFFAYRLGSSDRILETTSESHYPPTTDEDLRAELSALLRKYSPKLSDDVTVRRFSDPEFPVLGFRRFGHTVAISRQFPDWSLPIYWADTDDWSGLRLREGV